MGIAEGAVRRRPVQRRSAERVERMLDECARLLDEVGYDGVTTKEVARRAEVPIGTFYQFFRDKRGLVRELALRNLERFLGRVTARLADEAPGGLPEVIDMVVDEYVAMRRTVPGFGVVDFGETGPGGEHLLDAAVENNAIVAERLRDLTAGLGGDSDRSFLVAVEAADAVLKLAFRTRPEGDPGLIAECKTLLRRYLSGS
ncbi:TetR/AcrR family transcriptional regulator [Bailinhaonella thermotolerans]|uniref:TetR/AcrR family transcriptional regulator n=1 Tax=Bailinhaonella thermotolerans TaxID=1070861 RepID=A0A3A4B2N2_9ACTN|nr:TetR/AcrR family transcriptional regulator [Bailinhaonella thermotolerans]RJL32435.1 TetR/AcrR family transcriptional regulator [Bailinhaonella thermotolerans]